MVFAALGVLTATGAGDALRHRPGWKPLLATLAAGVMLFVLTGSNPDSDVLVHFGGFVAGLAVGGLLELASLAGLQRSWPQATALLMVGASFAAAWWWALPS
jgi:hypothetical protein